LLKVEKLIAMSKIMIIFVLCNCEKTLIKSHIIYD
jgi:hypothetical protein